MEGWNQAFTGTYEGDCCEVAAAGAEAFAGSDACPPASRVACMMIRNKELSAINQKRKSTSLTNSHLFLNNCLLNHVIGYGELPPNGQTNSDGQSAGSDSPVGQKAGKKDEEERNLTV